MSYGYFDEDDEKSRYSMQEVAQRLNIKKFGRTKLFQFLREQKIFIDGTVEPYYKYLALGFFVTESVLQANGIRHDKTYATPKGLRLIRELVKKHLLTNN